MKRILVVDDECHCRRPLVRLLRAEGYAVAEAANGQEAFSECVRERPDLVVLDLRMPVMDGASFLQQLRADPRWRNLPVVVVTAEIAHADVDRAMSRGVIGYFLKGHMAAERLLECIGRVLGHAPPEGEIQ